MLIRQLIKASKLALLSYYAAQNTGCRKKSYFSPLGMSNPKKLKSYLVQDQLWFSVINDRKKQYTIHH